MNKEKITEILSRYGGQNLYNEQVRQNISEDILYLSENGEIPTPQTFEEPTGVNPGTIESEEPLVVEETVEPETKKEEVVVEDKEKDSKDGFFEDRKKLVKKMSKRKPLKKRRKNVSRSQK